MTIYRQGMNTRINALIRSPEIGGWEAAVAIINTARPKTAPRISKGTITKRIQQNLEWPTGEWLALEDAAGRYTVIDYLAARAVEDELGDSAFSHLRTMKEGHEAIMAQAAAEESDDPEAILQAIKETADLRRIAERTEEALRVKLRQIIGAHPAMQSGGAGK